MALETFFPNYESTTFEEFDEMPFHDKKFCCELLQERNRISAYKFYSVCDRVVINLISSTIKQHSKLEAYFQYTIKNSLISNDISIKKIDWEKVHLRLNRDATLFKRRNTDVRTCFKIDQHKFIVPNLFTFGLKTVADGFIHLIETTSAPMYYYELNMEKVDGSVCLQENSFKKDDIFAYDKFILFPNTRYQIASNTKYILISKQKSIFSLHIFKQPVGEYAYGYYLKQHIENKNPVNMSPTPLQNCVSNETISIPTLNKIIEPCQQETNVQPSLQRKCETFLPPSLKRKHEEITLDDEIISIPSPKNEEEKHLEEIYELKKKCLFPEMSFKLTKSVYDYPTPTSLIRWMETDKMFPPVKNVEEMPEPIDLSPKKNISLEEDKLLKNCKDCVGKQNLTHKIENLLLLSDEEYNTLLAQIN